MEREELLDLCERYVRNRGLIAETAGGESATLPPVVEIVDGYLHAEISESEKNALLAYVRNSNADLGDDDSEHDEGFNDFFEPVFMELDDINH